MAYDLHLIHTSYMLQDFKPMILAARVTHIIDDKIHVCLQKFVVYPRFQTNCDPGDYKVRANTRNG